MKDGSPQPSRFFMSQQRSALQRTVRNNQCCVGVPNVKGGSDGRISRVSLDEPSVAKRDWSVFGLPSFGNPASYFKAALHPNVERRTISSGLAARNNLLEHETAALHETSEPSGHAFFLALGLD